MAEISSKVKGLQREKDARIKIHALTIQGINRKADRSGTYSALEVVRRIEGGNGIESYLEILESEHFRLLFSYDNSLYQCFSNSGKASIYYWYVGEVWLLGDLKSLDPRSEAPRRIQYKLSPSRHVSPRGIILENEVKPPAFFDILPKILGRTILAG